ncbi:hypothetical protein GCM10009735_86180 [Actinomadura chokoriensis]
MLHDNEDLREDFHTFGELEAACREFCDEGDSRVHRETRRRPAERLAKEQARLHLLPKPPFTIAFGTTRRVNWNATISVEGMRYSSRTS